MPEPISQTELADLFAITRVAEKRLLAFYDEDDRRLTHFFNFDQSVTTLHRLTAVHKTLLQMQHHINRQSPQSPNENPPTIIDVQPSPMETSHPIDPSDPSDPTHPTDASNSTDLPDPSIPSIPPEPSPAAIRTELAAIDGALDHLVSLDDLVSPDAYPNPFASPFPGTSFLAGSPNPGASPSPAPPSGPLSVPLTPAEIPAPQLNPVNVPGVPAVAACPHALKSNLDTANDSLDDLDDTPVCMPIEESDRLWRESHERWLNDPAAQEIERQYQAKVAAMAQRLANHAQSPRTPPPP